MKLFISTFTRLWMLILGILLWSSPLLAKDCDAHKYSDHPETLNTQTMDALLKEDKSLDRDCRGNISYKLGQNTYDALRLNRVASVDIKKYAKASLHFFKKAMEYVPDTDRQTTSRLYLAIITDEFLLKPFEAKKLYDEMLQYYEANKDSISGLYRAFTLHHLSEYEEQRGDIERAISYSEEAVEYEAEVPESLFEQFYTHLGGLYPKEGRKAINHLSKEIETRASAQRWHNLGNAYLYNSELDEALEAYKQALNLYDEGTREYAEIYNNRAVVYLRKYKTAIQQEDADNFLEIARQELDKAIEINTQLGRKGDLAFNHDNMGDWYKLQGKYDIAQKHYEQAITAATDRLPYDIRDSLITERTLAHISVPAKDLFVYLGSWAEVSFKQFELGKKDSRLLKQSLESYQRAIEVVDAMRDRVQTRSSKLFWISEGFSIFERAIEAALADDNDLLAYKWSEKAKATLLYSNLQERQAMAKALPHSLRQKEQEVFADILSAERVREVEADNLENLRKLYELRFKRDSLKIVIAKSHPQYFKVKYEKQIVDVPSLQQELDDQTAILEYFVGDNNLFIFKITKEEIQSYQLPPLEVGKVDSFKRIMDNYATDFKSNKLSRDKDLNYQEELKHLSVVFYKKLIAPLVKQETLPENLIIIPDGSLNYVPFEILAATNEQKLDDIPFLVKKHAISYAYSATIWHQRTYGQKEKASKPLLAFAPDIDHPNLLPLDEYHGKVSLIAEMFSGKTLRHAAANLEAFKSMASEFSILHLFTHGVIDTLNILNNYIAFSTENAKKDINASLLYMTDLYKLNLEKVELAVLAACHTAEGKFKRGEGVFSMARGFAYAGVRTTVMGLWEADAQSTSELMEKFYTYLSKGYNKSKALQAAKKDMIKQYNASPFYWAAFVLQGDSGVLQMPSTSWSWSGVGLILMLVVFGFAIYFLTTKRK